MIIKYHFDIFAFMTIDTGIGIQEEFYERVFEQFKQIDLSCVRKGNIERMD